MTETFVTPGEIGNLARLVNYFGIIGGQLISRSRPQHYQRAHANLQNFRRGSKELLEKVDAMARKTGDESALRLAEDLEREPADLAQGLNLARRCLLASAYLGHCIAEADRAVSTTATPAQPDKTLH
jgi:hypothetical protein